VSAKTTQSALARSPTSISAVAITNACAIAPYMATLGAAKKGQGQRLVAVSKGCVPAYLLASRQLGRTSAPMVPHFARFLRGSHYPEKVLPPPGLPPAERPPMIPG
jgi:hypothetical protein